MIHRVVSTATRTSTPREYRTNNIHPQFALFQIYKMTDFGAPLIRGDIIMGFENFYSACAVNISFTQPKKKKKFKFGMEEKYHKWLTMWESARTSCLKWYEKLKIAQIHVTLQR